jgi:predicted Ser/Thr protein kinase
MTSTVPRPEPSGQALPVGTRIEEFLIERVLGSGGFGITYLAKDTALGRQVVIKENLPVQFCFRDTHSLTVAPRHSHGEDADNFKWSLENFSKEAAMLASLDHPGIVKVHRSFEAFGTAYFVMPFVEGMALDELTKGRAGKPFPEKELLKLLERVLAALGYLHERGIYHRDIKPGNILITGESIPVLIDFGSARQRLSERSMTVVESAGYTPFEQLQSRGNVGPWSDLYALAATLVKVMTGEAPPKANDRTMGDPWQPLAGRGELKARYSDLFLQNLDRALRLPIKDRWQDAKGWMDALVVGSRHGVRHDHPVNETSRFETILPKPPGKRGRWIAISAMTVLLAATGWHFMRGDFTVGEEEMPTPAWGALVITSEPPGARLMDTRGTPLGTTPIELKGLDGGLSWEGTLEKDGYLVSKVAADVAAGETKPVPTVELKPKPQKVIVSSEPSGAAVLEGDKVLGVTPLELPEIPPGTKHVYQLELDGHEAMEVSGEVKVGESLRLNGQMKENPKPIVEPIDFTDLPPDWVSSQEELLPAFTNYLTSLKLRNISPEEVIRAHAKSKGEVWNTLPPREWWTRMGYTLRVVDRVASEMKAKEVKIISAYRSPAFNALCSHPDCEFDGKDSWHQANVAVDFTFPGISPEAVTEACRELRDRGLFKGGVGNHGSFTHLDVRGKTFNHIDAESDLSENNDEGVTDEEQVFEEKSLQSYLKLAASGDSESMWKIGRIYDEGINVPVDRSLAMEWYKKSADNGSVEGMFLYALCNELGKGSAVNMKTALHYYKLALENEHEEARRRYTSLVGGMEPSVEKGVESIIESD